MILVAAQMENGDVVWRAQSRRTPRWRWGSRGPGENVWGRLGPVCGASWGAWYVLCAPSLAAIKAIHDPSKLRAVVALPAAQLVVPGWPVGFEIPCVIGAEPVAALRYDQDNPPSSIMAWRADGAMRTAAQIGYTFPVPPTPVLP